MLPVNNLKLVFCENYIKTKNKTKQNKTKQNTARLADSDAEPR